MKTSVERMKDLVDILNRATIKYDEGNPIMNDKKWDNLYFELFDLEQALGYHFVNSPTQRVNYEVVNELTKVTHNHPMLSLQKTKSIEALQAFVGKEDYVIMLKLDGLTCSIKYKDGKLISAETRGNGEVGEDISHNIYSIGNIPKRISFKGELIIDGEIICKYEDFEEFKNDYKNPRNFAAGSIRLLDSKECANRKLSFVAWDVISAENIKFETLVDKFNFLIDNSIEVVNFNSTADLTKETIESMKYLAEGQYPIDGMVVKFNNCARYEAAGRTAHHFKGGIAYKFYEDEYETTLLDIEYTMGRTGVLTPVAIFEPIEIDGTVCERASLHNISVMEQLSGGFECKGDILYIFKAHEIIPQVSRWEHPVLPGNSTIIPLQPPHECPICGAGTVLYTENETKFLACSNPECEGKLSNRLVHFCGKKGLDIRGLADSTLMKLMDWGWINCYADIFNLKEKRNEWIQKSGFGVKSVDRILSAIELAKNTTLDKFISAIGIPLIGVSVAKELNKYISTYEEFRDKVNSKFDFSEYDGFGGQKNNYILNYDYTEADKVYEYLNIQIPQETTKSSIDLSNKVFVITGKLNNYKNRDELKEIIEAAGGKVASAISRNTTVLINNDITSKSSKNISAQKLGIPVITEEEFCQKYLTL